MLQEGCLADTGRCVQRLAHRVANVMCWSILLRLRHREAVLRQTLAAEQQKQLQALANTCVALLVCCLLVAPVGKPDADVCCREQAAKAQLVACSAGVLNWLRSLGNPSIALEDKWTTQLPGGELGCGPQLCSAVLQPCQRLASQRVTDCWHVVQVVHAEAVQLGFRVVQLSAADLGVVSSDLQPRGPAGVLPV